MDIWRNLSINLLIQKALCIGKHEEWMCRISFSYVTDKWPFHDHLSRTLLTQSVLSWGTSTVTCHLKPLLSITLPTQRALCPWKTWRLNEQSSPVLPPNGHFKTIFQVEFYWPKDSTMACHFKMSPKYNSTDIKCSVIQQTSTLKMQSLLPSVIDEQPFLDHLPSRTLLIQIALSWETLTVTLQSIFPKSPLDGLPFYNAS